MGPEATGMCERDYWCFGMIRGAGRGEQTPPLYDNENL